MGNPPSHRILTIEIGESAAGVPPPLKRRARFYSRNLCGHIASVKPYQFKTWYCFLLLSKLLLKSLSVTKMRPPFQGGWRAFRFLSYCTLSIRRDGGFRSAPPSTAVHFPLSLTSYLLSPLTTSPARVIIFP